MPIHASPFPAPQIPPVSIAELILKGVAPRGDAPVLIDGQSGATITGNQFIDRVRRLAGGLQARGFGPGRVIAVMLPNMPDFAIIFHGVAYCGSVLTPINPGYTAREVHIQLLDAGAELLITMPSLLDLVREAVAETRVAEIVVIGGEGPETPFSDLFGAPLARQHPVDLAGAPVVLPFSSGTTGLAKGVMLSHRNLVANALQLHDVRPVDPGEATIACLPFFHIYGMEVLMNHTLASGGVLVTMPRFDLETALRLIQTHGMRQIYIVPPVVLALAKHPMVDQFDLSTLKEIVSGAAPLGAELQRACEQRLNCEILQGYGLTESSPTLTIVPRGSFRPGTAGVPLAGTELRISDVLTGEDCPDGTEGEVIVRGPQVMIGYLDNPEATAAVLSPDGWLKTGDLGYMDGDGFLHLVDRVKELIKVKGFQVPPAELEALIVAHPDVADVAVVGRADEEAGERPVAFVVRVNGAAVDEAAIKANVAGQVAHYKHLAEVRFVDAIPKSPSGKILRRMLKGTL